MIRRMRIVNLLWCGVLVLAYGTASADGGQPVRRRLEVDGVRRAYVERAPSPERSGSTLPILVALHGHGGTARELSRIAGFDALADRAGVLVLYPEGSSWGHLPWRSWNAGACCGYARSRQVDDAAFIRAMLDDAARRHTVDVDRVYVTGASNGGMLAYRLACELSDRIAAIAPVAGALAVEDCRPAQPVSVIAFHGTDDDYIPYEGGDGVMAADHRQDAPARETIGWWSRHNGCVTGPEETVEGAISRLRFSGCRGGTDVVLITIAGGGHAWPGGRRGWWFGDRPTRDISATDVMWEFFEAHPKRRDK